jgi:DNA-binding CsgD family transcriptional regulator/tetratricopeptide (TPR) repeat protein
MSIRTSSPVLVGRAEQLAALDAALGRAASGGPAAVLIGGEAGIGKSRLVAEFTAKAVDGGARVLAGGCMDLGAEGLPFAPFAAMLRALVRDVGADGVAALMPCRATGEFARLLPEFGQEERSADTGLARARLFEQMLTLFERLAEGSPVVLIIEDAHWADRSTRDLVAFLIGSQQVLDRVLILVSYRSDELHRTHPLRPLLAELDRLEWVDRMELPRLGRMEADELVQRIADREPEPALADAIYARTQGNPMFVEELLCCDGQLSSELPESLRDLLLGSVRRLPEQTQELLRAASAGGQRNTHALLAAVTSMADDDLARFLRPAVAANVLLADRDGYTFRHALIREAVYDDLLPGERTRLHTIFADVLGSDADLAAAGRGLIERAHHWYYAHDMTWALISAWQAAAEVCHALAYAEQLTLLARVLELWDRVPDAADRIGATHLEVLEKAAKAAIDAHEDDRGLSFASAALKEIDQDTEPVRAALLLETRATLSRHAGASDRSADLRAALRLVPAGTDDAARSRVLVSIARHVTDPASAQTRAALDEALALARRTGDADTEVNALCERALFESRFGSDAVALEMLAQARQLAERIGAYGPMLCAAINETHVLEGIGEHERAAELARAGISGARQDGLARSTGTFLAINLAEPLVSLGRWGEATEVIEHALALSPPQLNRVLLRNLLADIALRRGDLDKAQAMSAAARRAFGLAKYPGHYEGQYTVPLAQLEAEIAHDQGRHVAAIDVLSLAIERLDLVRDQRCGWPLLVAAARVCTEAQTAVPVDADSVERAAALLTRLREVAENTRATGPVQRADRLTFEAYAEVDWRQRRARWETAATAWNGVHQPYPLATALRQAGEAAIADGDRDAALRHLRDAAQLAESLGARPLAASIAAVARGARIDLAVGTRAGAATVRRPDPGRPAVARLGLTAREFEVLRLVADGRSNPEVGAELFITAKTASVHVSNILAKLGVNSRGEAAAAAHRLRLFEAVPSR